MSSDKFKIGDETILFDRKGKPRGTLTITEIDSKKNILYFIKPLPKKIKKGWMIAKSPKEKNGASK